MRPPLSSSLRSFTRIVTGCLITGGFSEAAVLVPDRTSVTQVAFRDRPAVNVTVNLTSPSGPAAWTATSGTAGISVTASGTAPGPLVLTLDPTVMSGAGDRSGNITVRSGADTLNIPVTMRAVDMRISQMVADLERPVIYALNQNFNDTRVVFVINDQTGEVTEAIPAGSGALHVEVDYRAGNLLVTNWDLRQLRTFSIATRQLLSTHTFSFSTASAINVSPGVHMIGTGGAPAMVNSSTGAVIRQLDFLIFGGGGTQVDAGGHWLYEANRLGGVYRVDLSPATPALTQTLPGTSSGPLVLAPNGNRVSYSYKVYDPEFNEVGSLPAQTVALTFRGELALSRGTQGVPPLPSAVYAVDGGLPVLTLSYQTSDGAFSRDQRRLITYDSTARVINVHNLPGEPIPPPGAVTMPADGESIMLPLAELQWDAVPSAVSYRVFLGTSAAAVAAAGTSSPEYLGQTRDNYRPAPAGMVNGTAWFWRVDVVRSGGTTTGTVRQFRTIDASVTPSKVDVTGVAGASDVRIPLTVNAGAATVWSFSESQPWISLKEGSGVGPGTATLVLSPAELPKNVHSAEITFTAGGESASIPVRFAVRAMNITKLESEPGTALLYGINDDYYGSNLEPGAGHIVAIDPATGKIVKTAPIPDYPTDLDIAADGIYVICKAGNGQILRFDPALDTSESRSLAGMLDTNNGHDYRPRLAAAGNGIVYWRDLAEYQHRIHTLNFTTGAEIGTPVIGPAEAGGAESRGAEDIQMSVDGTMLLATKNVAFSSSQISELWRFTLNPAPVFKDTSGAMLALARGASIVSAPLTGTTFAGDWGFQFSPLTKGISRFPVPLTAASPDGSLAFSKEGIFRGLDGRFIGNLPVTTQVMAASGNDRLVYYAAGALHSVSLDPWRYDVFSEPPDGAALTVAPARLRVPAMSGSGDYAFYFGTTAAAVAAAGPASPEFIGTAAIPETALTLTPSPLEVYYWRADRGAVRGTVHRFMVRAPLVDRVAIGINSSTRLASDGDDLIVSYSSSPEEIGFFRRTRQTDRFARVGGYTSSLESYRLLQTAIKGDQAWVGSPDEEPVDAGAAYYFGRGAAGIWPAPARFTANTVRSGEQWGTALAAGDNYIAVGVPGYSNFTGCVDVMNPSTGVRIIRLTVPGASQFHRNGSAVAASGSWIAAQGRVGTGGTSISAVKLFRRTASWAYASAIQRSNPAGPEDAGFGDALALDGDTLAVSAGDEAGERRVLIYSLASGTPVLQHELAGAPGDTDNRFGRHLALRNGILAISASREIAGIGADAGRIHLYRKPTAPATVWEPLAPVEMPASAGPSSGLGGALAMTDRYLFGSATTNGGLAGTSVFVLNPVGNRAPWIETTVPQTAMANRAVVWPVIARDDDPGDTATISTVSLPPFLTFVGGMLQGTPNAAGTFNVDLLVTDNRGGRRNERYVLAVAPTGGVPAFSLVPEDTAAVSGSPLVLRADAPAVPAVTWQWYFEGRPVPGATQKALTLDHADAGDAGRWFVRMSHATGYQDSPEITVTVPPAVNRFAGDWMMPGNDSGHTSFYPATFGTHTWRRKWKVAHGTRALLEAVIADGRVHACNESTGSGTLKAFNLKTGLSLWSANITANGDLSGPAADRFGVYSVAFESTSLRVASFKPDSGLTDWKVNTFLGGSSSNRHAAPAITPWGLRLVTSTSGAGVDFQSAPQFRAALSRPTDTPVRMTMGVSGPVAAAWIGGTLDVFMAESGEKQFSIVPDPADTTSGGTPVMAGTVAIVRSATKLHAIDLESQTVMWSRAATGSSLPALHGSELFLLEGSTVVARSLATGNQIRTYTAEAFEPTSGFQAANHPIVTNDLVIASTPAKTFIFDRATGTVKTTLADGGLPALTDGWLILAGRDGNLAGYYAGQAPEISPADRTLFATEDVPFTWTLQPVDYDGDTASLTVVSKPAWLTATAGAQGSLILTGTPLQAHIGSAPLLIRASDSAGDISQTLFTVQVAAVNDTPLTGAEAVMTTDEDQPVTINLRSPALATDEEDGTALTWTVETVHDPSLLDASVDAAGSLTVIPRNDRFGETTIDLLAADSGGLTISIALRVTVRPVNDRPVAGAAAPVKALEDRDPLMITLDGLFSDVDDPADTLILTLPDFPPAAPAAHAEIIGRVLRISLVPDAFGPVSLTVRATDAGGLFAETVINLEVAPVPDAPAVPVPAPPQILAAAAELWTLDAGSLFTDADPGERLTFTIEENTNAPLFASLTADPGTGRLSAAIAPYRWGNARIRLRATGTDALFTDTWIELTVPRPADPALSAVAVPRLSRQTGLSEWTIRVRNEGPRPLGGCEVLLSGLPSGMDVYNASGRNGETWIIRLDTVFAPGEEKDIVVEFYSASRDFTGLPPAISARPVMPEDLPPPAPDAGLAIDRIQPIPGGMIVEFPSTPGTTYQIQWSDGGGIWKDSLVPLRAAGTRVQWIDRGPPRTGSAPPLAPQRFYRVSEFRRQ